MKLGFLSTRSSPLSFSLAIVLRGGTSPVIGAHWSTTAGFIVNSADVGLIMAPFLSLSISFLSLIFCYLPRSVCTEKRSGSYTGQWSALE